MKKFVKSIFNSVGLDIRKKVNPVELSDADNDLIKFVRKNDLTMVSDDRLYTTLMACKHVLERKVNGDFVECGVWRGGNAILAAGIFKQYGSQKRTYLFDTFSGMTEPISDDVSYTGKVAKKWYELKKKADHIDWCYASLDEVRKNFEKAELLDEKVSFVRGDVLETLQNNELLPEKISVLRLDTDWHESTKAELEILYPRLSIGGVLIIDDYGHWSGSKKAVDEYFETNGNRPFLQYTDFSGRAGVKHD